MIAKFIQKFFLGFYLLTVIAILIAFSSVFNWFLNSGVVKVPATAFIGNDSEPVIADILKCKVVGVSFANGKSIKTETPIRFVYDDSLDTYDQVSEIVVDKKYIALEIHNKEKCL